MWSYAVQSAWEVGQTHYMLDIPQHGRLLVCASQITPVAPQTLFLWVCVFVLFKKNLQLPYWGCLVLPGNQSGLNQDTHKTLNPHTRARIHSGGSGTISCIAARCIRGGAVRDVLQRCNGSEHFAGFSHTPQVCVCLSVDLPKLPHGFAPAVSALCSKNMLCASSWRPHCVEAFFVGFFCVLKSGRD